MEPTRRTILKVGAWSTPLIVAAVAVPAYAASGDPGAPESVLAASFPGVITQPGLQWIDFEVTNTSLTDALNPVLQGVPFGAGRVTQVEVPPLAGWAATLTSDGGVTIAGGIVPAGRTVAFRIEMDVQPDANGDVLAMTVLDNGTFRDYAQIGISSAASTRPTVVPSYGPNGTHWPAHTPWIGDTAAKIIVVDCTWKAIETAIVSVTDAEAAAGVHIKVRPGSLPGNGVSSGSTPVMKTRIGKQTWTQNVLVSPRDGWGTVKVTASAGARIREMYGVTIARIDATEILLTNCSRSVWAQSKMSVGLRMASSYESITRHCDAYEIVMADAKTAIADPLGYAAGEFCVITTACGRAATRHRSSGRGVPPTMSTRCRCTATAGTAV